MKREPSEDWVRIRSWWSAAVVRVTSVERYAFACTVITPLDCSARGAIPVRARARAKRDASGSPSDGESGSTAPTAAATDGERTPACCRASVGAAAVSIGQGIAPSVARRPATVGPRRPSPPPRTGHTSIHTRGGHVRPHPLRARNPFGSFRSPPRAAAAAYGSKGCNIYFY